MRLAGLTLLAAVLIATPSPADEPTAFPLKDGVKWQNKPPVNGRPFSSADVAWMVDHNKREGLQRLGGGAHEGRQRRVAGHADHLAVTNSHRVNPVRRLDDPVAAHLDEDRLAHAHEPYADWRMVGVSSMVGICRPLMATTTRPTTR